MKPMVGPHPGGKFRPALRKPATVFLPDADRRSHGSDADRKGFSRKGDVEKRLGFLARRMILTPAMSSEMREH